MKKTFWPGWIIFALILLSGACEKDKDISSGEIEYKIAHWPAVKTIEAINLTSTTATLKGAINSFGLSTRVLFEYGTTTGYGDSVIAIQSPVKGDSLTYVSADIAGLSSCVTYHFRLKAENSQWIKFYSSDTTFITPLAHIPTLLTTPISDLTEIPGNITAKSGGNITDAEGTEMVLSGVYWSASESGLPPVNSTGTDLYFTEDGPGTGSFISTITGLSRSNTYYVRSYAEHCAGTSFGNIISFSPAKLPNVTILRATSTDTLSVTLNGTVYGYSLLTDVSFEYGSGTDYGSVITADQSPITGNAGTNISAIVTGLATDTFHYRLKAVNPTGTSYSGDMEYSGCLPTVTTGAATNVRWVSFWVIGRKGVGHYINIKKATLNGTVTANVLPITVEFEFITSGSKFLAAIQSPLTDYDSTYVSLDCELPAGADTGRFRIKATNACGTTYGEITSF